jgi:hypothetical protein
MSIRGLLRRLSALQVAHFRRSLRLRASKCHRFYSAKKEAAAKAMGVKRA